MNIGDPISFSPGMERDEALMYLRDTLATLHWENLEKHASHIKRKDLGDNPRYDYMVQRCKEYQKTKWTKDVWDEELTQYLDKEDREMIVVAKSYENIHVSKKTAGLIVHALLQNQIERMYDFKGFMHENWDKRIV